MTRVACIDIGTVTCRLAMASVEGGRVVRLDKRSTICDLGEGLSATGRIGAAARRRVGSCVADYMNAVRAAGVPQVCCTLTSAARDAANSDELLADLAACGLTAQVIDGSVEGALTFAGVTSDFAGQAVLVADNGGGSTELAAGFGPAAEAAAAGGTVPECAAPATGGAAPGPTAANAEPEPAVFGPLFVESVDVGCRRVTERFLSADGPDVPAGLAAAHRFARELLAPAAARARAALPAAACPVLVTCGGTVTSLVAMRDALVPYDSTRVHLARLTRQDVERLETELAARTVAERARTPGLQPQRAAVIVGGIVCVAELLRAAGVDELIVSEHDLLHGLALAAAAAATDSAAPVGWQPELTPLAR